MQNMRQNLKSPKKSLKAPKDSQMSQSTARGQPISTNRQSTMSQVQIRILKSKQSEKTSLKCRLPQGKNTEISKSPQKRMLPLYIMLESPKTIGLSQRPHEIAQKERKGENKESSRK